MNTTAEKKRILSMPELRAEVRINGVNHVLYPCPYDRTILAVETKNETDPVVIVHANYDYIRIGTCVFNKGFDAIHLEKIISYEDLTILTATYNGQLEQKQEVMQAA